MYHLSHSRFLLRNTQRTLFSFGISLPFSTTVITKSPTPQNTFIIDYLINSCGFSRDEAIDTSIGFTHINSPEKPDSVLKFLKQSGFDNTHIKNLISRRPRFLSSNIDETLKPKFEFLQNLGLSGPSLADLIIKNNKILLKDIDTHLKPSIDYLQTFLQTNENIISALKKNSSILSLDLQKIIIPNVEFLRQCGVSDRQISDLLLKEPRFFAQKLDWLEKLISRVETLGVQSGSGMFVDALIVISTMSKTTLESKFELFKRFGWSEKDISSAFRKSPDFLIFSERKIGAMMDFLLNKLSYKPSEIAFRPKLFTYSLEKRLIPRNEVLKILKSKGLLERNHDLLSVANLSEKTFRKDYVLRYIDRAPDLQQAYMDCM
ncbi:uncharacterized protein LOC143853753 [Tasmannia lanceolata]|uniref:uncharacterized protein LOC143853753 n=1 Tax=Tasmannia lanceolata TaxID=3420 RepID=UPI004063E1D9